jgi:hypothetical protein
VPPTYYCSAPGEKSSIFRKIGRRFLLEKERRKIPARERRE